MERTHSHKVAVGVFEDEAHAQSAVRDLKSAGFTDQQIGVVAHDKKPGSVRQPTRRETESGSKAAEGAAVGVAAGAGVGALWALGIAAGMLPAIGPVVAGGILGSILLSAAGGAAVAGIAGALIGLGIPEEEARYYETEFRGGRTIVTVRTEDRYEEAVEIMERSNGFNMKRRTEMAARPGRTETAHRSHPAPQPHQAQHCSTETSGATASQQTVKLHDEELDVRKKPVSKGDVRVTKEVVTEHKTIDVPVTREEVVIERRPAGDRSASCSDIGKQEVRIPVKEEEIEVQKRAVVREEVSVGKRKVQETRNVSGDVRHEKLKVEKTGDAHVKRV
jgi:uncharacterized protein (TIGR02271 family)